MQQHQICSYDAMAFKQQHIELAKSLPPRLMNFLRKYPPPALFQSSEALSESTQSGPSAQAPNTSPADPNVSSQETQPALPPSATLYHNPFQPYKNWVTGKWRGPRYGLRQQADLVKLAAKHGVEELLPYTIKGTGERARRREERGLRIKGTGVGERVKGKQWERTLKGRLEERRQAMLNMPQMIEDWKNVSRPFWNWHGTIEANLCIARTRSWVEEVA